MDIRWIRWIALACIVLLVSSVSAVPFEASESLKDYFDADAMAKSVTVDIKPSVGADGKTNFGVTLGSTDVRYQALNGKSFTIDPKQTDGGLDVAVDAKGAGIDQMLSGKPVHIPPTVGGVDINDPSAIDTPAFDSIVQSQVTGLVADVPMRQNQMDRGIVGASLSSTPGITYRQAFETAFFTTYSVPTYTFVGTTSTQKQSWWQWTKEKCKAAWEATKEFVEEHWLAIVIAILVLIIVTLIVLFFLWFFALPPPLTAPLVQNAVHAAMWFALCGGLV